jgi:hypothetical protein
MGRSFNDLTAASKAQLAQLVSAAEYLFDSGLSLSEIVEVVEEAHNSGLAEDEKSFALVSGAERGAHGVDTKYGRVIFEKIPGNPFIENEPVFVIRCRDSTSADGVELYGDNAQANGAHAYLRARVDERASEFRQWQKAHPELVKLPD